MLKWLGIIGRTLWSALRTQRDLAIENLALRQQLSVLKHRHPQPSLTDADRLVWVVLSGIWPGWRESLHIVQPETVVRWHRQGFRYYWRWKSRRRGRPRIDPDIWHLIRRMCRANPLWGVPEPGNRGQETGIMRALYPVVVQLGADKCRGMDQQVN